MIKSKSPKGVPLIGKMIAMEKRNLFLNKDYNNW